MEEDEDKPGADKIIREISRLEKELNEIQSKCKHEEWKIELYKFSLVKVCTACYKKIGYPNEQERKKSGYI
tara:strand:- start:699 stop:911 length:213 start_codon:yes stop_codon:yes gene_type:complete